MTGIPLSPTASYPVVNGPSVHFLADAYKYANRNGDPFTIGLTLEAGHKLELRVALLMRHGSNWNKHYVIGRVQSILNPDESVQRVTSDRSFYLLYLDVRSRRGELEFFPSFQEALSTLADD